MCLCILSLAHFIFICLILLNIVSLRYSLFVSISCTIGYCTLLAIILALSPMYIPYIYNNLSGAVQFKLYQYIYIMIPVLYIHSILRLLQKYMYYQNIIRAVHWIEFVGVWVHLLGIWRYVFRSCTYI